ncbi:MAG: putative surface-exposed virulence protein [Actinomycetota bacterium]
MDAPLRSGDALTVVRGIAVVKTTAGQMLVRPGTTLSFGGPSPRVERGDVLVVATKPFDIASRAATVTVTGIARLHQALSLEVGVYRGSAKVTTAADSLTVPVLRRAVIAGLTGATLGSTTPLALDAGDSWDRNLMGVALELDAALSSRSRGLTLQVANATTQVRDNVLSAAHQWTDLTVLAPELPVGETVVAAELAKAGQFTESQMRNVLALRAEGASWGLVAIAEGIRSVPPEIPGIDAAVVPVVNNVAGAVLDPNTVITTPSAVQATQPPLVNPATGTAPTTPKATPAVTVTAPMSAPDSAPVVADPLGPIVKGVGSVLSGLLSS